LNSVLATTTKRASTSAVPAIVDAGVDADLVAVAVGVGVVLTD
jgi:hypothetical protein